MRNVFLDRFHPDQRPVSTIPLLKHVGVLEVVFKLSSALYPGVTDLTDFDRVELVPFPLMEIFVEVGYEFGMDEVDESIANVTAILDSEICTL